MYQWILQNSNYVTKTSACQKVYNSKEQQYDKVFSIERDTLTLINSFLNNVQTEVKELKNSSFNYPLEDQVSVNEVYLWFQEDSSKVGRALEQMVPFITHEKAANVFQKSMDRLEYLFHKRRDTFWRNDSDLDSYLEWLLDLPFFVRERMDSAASLVTRLEKPIVHHETHKKAPSSPVYRGNIEPEEARASQDELALCC